MPCVLRPYLGQFFPCGVYIFATIFLPAAFPYLNLYIHLSEWCLAGIIYKIKSYHPLTVYSLHIAPATLEGIDQSHPAGSLKVPTYLPT